MKVISILGSPRKNGTSARVAKAFTDVAAAKGADVKEYYLNGMDYRGCQGCEKCHTKLDKCVLKDDLTPLLDEMHTADVLVYSSPVYYLDTSGQFKTFFDRTWSHVHVDYSKAEFYTSRLPAGKKAVFILTQADAEEKQKHIVDRYSMFMDIYGLECTFVRGTGLPMTGPDVDVSDAQAEAVKIAESLF
jgi:multimeric flavodoxin WrbA